MNEWVLLAIGIVLIIGTGLFVASEFTLVNLDRAELEARQGRGETMLGPVIRALRVTSTHLSSAQLGITLTTLLTGFTLEPAFSILLEPLLTSLGLGPSAVSIIATIVGVAVATLLSMIIGELVPKNLALALPRQVAKVVIPFQLGFTTVFRPFVRLLNGTANVILRAIGVEPREEISSARTAEELTSLVRRSASQGALDRDTATLLARTLLFSGHTASDVMTPRPRVASVDRSETALAVIELARRTGYSRFPVIDGDIDDIVGSRAPQAGRRGSARATRRGAGVGPAVRGAAGARDDEARHPARRAARSRIPDGGRGRRVRRHRRRRHARGPRRGARRRGLRRARPVARRMSCAVATG